MTGTAQCNHQQYFSGCMELVCGTCDSTHKPEDVREYILCGGYGPLPALDQASDVMKAVSWNNA